MSNRVKAVRIAERVERSQPLKSSSTPRMQSTLVDVSAVAGGGKGTNPKTTLYVGGLEENVNEAILHSAFIPFGDIKDVNIPLDHATGAFFQFLSTQAC